MPRFAITELAATREVHAIRARCDGCDAPRPHEERTASARVWLATSGCFELRDGRGRHVVDPATAFVFAPGHAFTIRHPHGADTCVAFSGAVADAIAARGTGPRRLPAAAHVRLLAEVAAWRRGEGDALALAEALGAVTEPEADPPDRTAPTRGERALADELAHELHLAAGEPVTLAQLAAKTGVSMFHASRVFQRARGVGLHAYRRELRLRHALALLVDTSVPIADVAAQAGFASQSHLTNRFRERFGTTPRAARLGRLSGTPRRGP